MRSHKRMHTSARAQYLLAPEYLPAGRHSLAALFTAHKGHPLQYVNCGLSVQKTLFRNKKRYRQYVCVYQIPGNSYCITHLYEILVKDKSNPNRKGINDYLRSTCYSGGQMSFLRAQKHSISWLLQRLCGIYPSKLMNLKWMQLIVWYTCIESV